MKSFLKILYFSFGSLLTVIAALFIGTVLASNEVPTAQSTPSAPLIIVPTADATLPPSDGRPPFLGDTDLAGYTIAYLADATIAHDGGLLSSTSLFGEYAHIFTDMAELRTFDDAQPVDVLVIHGSARDRVDTSWVANAVRKGIVFVTIDVPMSERTEWIDSDCDRLRLTRENFEETGHYAYASTVFATGENEADKAAMIEHTLNGTCADEKIPQLSTLTLMGSSWQKLSNLDSEGGVTQLQDVIREQLWNQQQMTYNYINRHSPTPVPTFTFVGS